MTTHRDQLAHKRDFPTNQTNTQKNNNYPKNELRESQDVDNISPIITNNKNFITNSDFFHSSGKEMSPN